MAWWQRNPRDLGGTGRWHVIARRVATPCMAFTLMAGTIAGCGSGGQTSSEQQVTKVVHNLQTLSRSGKADQICTQIFTSAEAQAIARHSGVSCAEQVRRQLVSASTTFTVKSVRIKGHHALVSVVEGNGNHTGLYLIQQNGAWRINAVYAIH